MPDKVNVLEQSMRKNVVEIYGIPSTKEERVMDILKRVSNVRPIGFELNDTKIDNCYRIKHSKEKTGTNEATDWIFYWRCFGDVYIR